VAPMLFGGDDALGLFRGAGAPTINDAYRGSFESIEHIGADLKLTLRR
jgi:riboflavin biosynthesis pyrimidine reductase